MKAVALTCVSKIFPGGKKAIDSVSIHLDEGEVFGFLGPNGAGKTTTVKLLNGMLTPTGGKCHVFGINPSMEPEKVHALSGVMTEHAQMYDSLTGLQNLVFYGAVFGLSAAISVKRGKALLKQLELEDAMDQKLTTYSTGMRQRLSLARALLHEPKILFLDEPTSGLDPEGARNVHAMIRKLAQEKGITVFLCTHQLRYAQEICTRYGLMDQGRLLAAGTLEVLRGQAYSHGQPSLQPPEPGLSQKPLHYNTYPGITIKIEADGIPEAFSYKKVGSMAFEVKARSYEEIPAIVQRIVEAGNKVYHVSSNQLSLEDIYFILTENQKKEKNGL